MRGDPRLPDLDTRWMATSIPQLETSFKFMLRRFINESYLREYLKEVKFLHFPEIVSSRRRPFRIAAHGSYVKLWQFQRHNVFSEQGYSANPRQYDRRSKESATEARQRFLGECTTVPVSDGGDRPS